MQKLTAAEAVTELKVLSHEFKMSEWLAPQNLGSERERFLASSQHNPQIVYPDLPTSRLLAWEEKIKKLEWIPADDITQWWLERKQQELLLQLKMLLSNSSQEFSLYSQKLVECSFAESYLTQAREDSLLDVAFTAQTQITMNEVVSVIKKYLDSYLLEDWAVILSDKSDFYFRVKASNKQLLVGNRFNWDFTDLDTMLAHEVDGHVLRAVNSKRRQHPLFRNPLPFYIRTEEGLASFLGDFCSPNSEVTLKHHALKYLAGHLALTAGFKEVFEFLVDHGFTPELAFQRTFRLKRGLRDTGTPGCYAKEAVYYEGMLDVKAYVDAGGDISKLFAAKVGLADLKLLTEVNEVIIPNRITEYQKTVRA